MENKAEMVFTCSLPPTLNHSYGIVGNRMYKKNEAKQWQKSVGWMMKNAHKYQGAVAVEIVMYLKYDRDIDSSLKLILDTLEEMEVYPNDKLIRALHIYKFKDKENPRMTVKLQAI